MRLIAPLLEVCSCSAMNCRALCCFRVCIGLPIAFAQLAAACLPARASKPAHQKLVLLAAPPAAPLPPAGRVKTLHPGVHGGILARRDLPDHMAAIAAHDISTIDIVVVNLYPFRQTVTAASKPSYEVRHLSSHFLFTFFMPAGRGCVEGSGVQPHLVVSSPQPWQQRQQRQLASPAPPLPCLP